MSVLLIPNPTKDTGLAVVEIGIGGQRHDLSVVRHIKRRREMLKVINKQRH